MRDVTAAALDSLARLHASARSRDCEASAHARLAVRLRLRGARVAARLRVKKALEASPFHARALAELAELALLDESDEHCRRARLERAKTLSKAFEPLLQLVERQHRLRETSQHLTEQEADCELAAWCSFSRALARDALQPPKHSQEDDEDDADDQQQRKALATHVLAASLAICTRACAGGLRLSLSLFPASRFVLMKTEGLIENIGLLKVCVCVVTVLNTRGRVKKEEPHC